MVVKWPNQSFVSFECVQTIVTSIFTPNIQQMNLYLQTNFLVNGLFKSFVIDYGPNLAFTICCPKRSGNFHSGLTNIKPVKKQKHNLVSITYFQCWTKGRSSTAVAEDLRPMATAMVAEV